MRSAKSSGVSGKIRRADPELQREVERGRRLAAAGNANQDHLRLREVARVRAVVMRLGEVDRLHPREIILAVGDAVGAARRVRALGLELGLERRDEDLEEIERERVRVAANGRTHRLVDDRAEHDRRLDLAHGRLVDLTHGGIDLVGRVDERDRLPLEVEILELRQQAVAEHLRRDAGAIGNEEHGAAVRHRRARVSGRADARRGGYQSCQTGTTPAGIGGKSPKSIQLSPGPW